MRKYNAPRVKESRGVQILTTIWLVPFIAMVITLWLGYQYYAKIGSTVEITFESSAGLIENQSPIKMRDVTVGIVKKISLSEDGKGVIIRARMNTEVSDYLNVKAQFWIVHPNVGSDGISGLDTIVSGSYIELYGKKEEETTHTYVGLEKALIDDQAKGTYYILSAPNSYNIKEGGHIYYRMMDVGRVERVGISPDGKHVNFTILIEKEFTNFINNKSQFYARNNLNIDFSQGNLDMTLAPLSQLVNAGISVYTPSHSLDHNYSISKNTIFPLYKNLSQMKAKHLGIGGKERVYQLSFNEPTTKLTISSPIEFRGFQVGYVTEIENRYNEQNQSVESLVYALFYLEAFQNENRLKELVQKGLKATLSTSMPLIGSQFIDLIFDTQAPSKIQSHGTYEQFPTIQAISKPNIMDNLNALISKLQKLPLKELLISTTQMIDQNKKPINKLIKNSDKTIKGLNRTILNFNNTINNLNKLTSNASLHALPDTINFALYELEETLKSIQKLSSSYDGDSKLSDQLSVTLEAISEASKSFDKINKMLDRKANALVIGDK